MQIHSIVERYTPRQDDLEAGMTPGFQVVSHWESDHVAIDRPLTQGFILPAGKRSLAIRLASAIRAGVVFTAPEIKRDVNGKTYVSAACSVIGRTMNADLKRMGF